MNLNNTTRTLSAESGTNEVFFKERYYQDFPGDPVVKNLPANSRDTGLIFDLERFPHVSGQLSLCANNCWAHAPQEKPPQWEAHWNWN